MVSNLTVQPLQHLQGGAIKLNKKCINLKGMMKAGPYSHAVEANGFIFLSGSVPVHPETGEPVVNSIKEATARTLDNIKLILDEAGSSLDKVVRVGVFLKEMSYFKEMNEVYATYFTSDQPARTCVAVKEMPADFPIEIEVVALK